VVAHGVRAGCGRAEVTHARLLRAMTPVAARRAEQRWRGVVARFADALDLLFYDLTTCGSPGTVRGGDCDGTATPRTCAGRPAGGGGVCKPHGLAADHEVFEGMSRVTTCGDRRAPGPALSLAAVIFVADRGCSRRHPGLLEALTLPGAGPSSTSSPSPPPLYQVTPAWPLSIPPGQSQPRSRRKAWRMRRWRMAGGWWWRTIRTARPQRRQRAERIRKCWCSRAPWKPSSSSGCRVKGQGGG